MATSISAHVPLARPAGEARPGLISRIMSHMMRAREMEAKRRIAGYAFLLDDRTLDAAGLTREEIQSWHNHYLD